MTALEYRHVPTGTLAILAQRLARVWASPSTWYQLAESNPTLLLEPSPNALEPPGHQVSGGWLDRIVKLDPILRLPRPCFGDESFTTTVIDRRLIVRTGTIADLKLRLASRELCRVSSRR